jgi:hypothetical protein
MMQEHRLQRQHNAHVEANRGHLSMDRISSQAFNSEFNWVVEIFL